MQNRLTRQNAIDHYTLRRNSTQVNPRRGLRRTRTIVSDERPSNRQRTYVYDDYGYKYSTYNEWKITSYEGRKGVFEGTSENLMRQKFDSLPNTNPMDEIPLEQQNRLGDDEPENFMKEELAQLMYEDRNEYNRIQTHTNYKIIPEEENTQIEEVIEEVIKK